VLGMYVKLTRSGRRRVLHAGLDGLCHRSWLGTVGRSPEHLFRENGNDHGKSCIWPSRSTFPLDGTIQASPAEAPPRNALHHRGRE
jgi:hypothetical protein